MCCFCVHVFAPAQDYFKGRFTEMGMNMAESRLYLEEFFLVADVDHDGRIDPAEFTKLYKAR